MKASTFAGLVGAIAVGIVLGFAAIVYGPGALGAAYTGVMRTWYWNVVQPGEVRDCEARGLAYYKRIGSWPALSDGRPTEKAVASKCRADWTSYSY